MERTLTYRKLSSLYEAILITGGRDCYSFGDFALELAKMQNSVQFSGVKIFMDLLKQFFCLKVDVLA